MIDAVDAVGELHDHVVTGVVLADGLLRAGEGAKGVGGRAVGGVVAGWRDGNSDCVRVVARLC